MSVAEVASSRLPSQFSDIADDLLAFFKSLNPDETLLDVGAIATASVLTDGMGIHGGMSGAMKKIALTYNSDDSNNGNSNSATDRHRPPFVICKSTKDSEQSRAHSKSMQLPREGLFLRHIQSLQVALARGGAKAGESSPLLGSSPFATSLRHNAPTLVHGLPTIYFSNGDMDNGTKMILCEDLSLPREVRVGSGDADDKAATTAKVCGIQSGWLLGPHSILNRGIDLEAEVEGRGWLVTDDVKKEKHSADHLLHITTESLVKASFLSAAELHGSFWMKPLEAYVGEGGTGAVTAGAVTSTDTPFEYLRGAKWFASSNYLMSHKCKEGRDAAADAALSPPSNECSQKTDEVEYPAFYREGKALYDGSVQLAYTNWAGYKKRLNEAKAKEDASDGESLVIPNNVSVLMDVCCPADTPILPYERYLAALTHNPARPHTLVHGDFHPGNMVVYADEEVRLGGANKDKEARQPFRIALVDWEVVGIGSGPQDIGQYMISHFTEEQFQRLALPCVEAYADKLITVIRESGGEDASRSEELRTTITREVCVGALGRWAWLLGLMGGMEAIPLQAMTYFNGQVDSFISWCTSDGVADRLGVPRDAKELAEMVGMCRP